MIDVVELLQHWHAGRRIGELSSSLGIDPKTIRKYTKPAMEAGVVPGGPPLRIEQWRALVESWFPELSDPSLRHGTWPLIEPYHELIAGWVGAVTVSTIHQRLRDDHGLGASQSSLRRYIDANFDTEAAEEAVRVLRETPPAGEEAQVDYGLLGRWFDPVAQRMRRVWGFLMVLSFSRMMFLRPVLRMDEASWVAAHVAAFEFYGGAVRRVVPDNLKTGVVRPDLYDPLINKAFGEFAAFYGCLVDPARAAKPRDKGTVERAVPYARDSFFAGRAGEFASLADMQADALRWSACVANARQHRGLDRLAPQAVFDAEEAGALLALPPAPFELANWSSPKVPPDIHVKVGGALYSVPWRHIGSRVDARASEASVEIYLDGVLVASHPRIERGRQTNPDHYPPHKIAFMMRTPTWCRRRGAELGPAVAAVVGELMELNALYRLRQSQGVIGLADKHGAERLDAACAKALAVGDPSYKTIKGILAAGTEHDQPAPAQTAPSAPAHLHGPEVLLGLEQAQ